MATSTRAGNTTVAALALAHLVGCSFDGHSSATQSLQFVPDYQPLQQIERKVWGITVADFDLDGDEDLFIGGHGEPNHRDKIHYFDSGVYATDGFDFRRSPDRHGCSAADVNKDGAVDLYCASGAERGAGGNPNELWLGTTDPARRGQFIAAAGAAGAAYASSRGRRAIFMDANADSLPDLYVTVWGDREDELPNESALFMNLGGQFERIPSELTGRWGDRCIAHGDISGNGAVDLIVCNEKQGAQLFINSGEGQAEGAFRRVELPWSKRWWMGLALVDRNRDNRLEVVGVKTGRKGGSMFILRYDPRVGDPGTGGSGTGRIEILREISLASVFDGCIPHSLAVQDVTGDGAPEVYVTRKALGAGNKQCIQGTDAIFLGPDWSRYIAVADDDTGRPVTAFAANGHFLRATAGPDWEGLVDIVTLLDTSLDRDQPDQVAPR